MAVDVFEPNQPAAYCSGSPLERVARLRVLVVDSHEVVHLGLRQVLGREPWIARCIGTTGVAQAIALACRYEPHLAVVGLQVDGRPWPEVCARIRHACPGIRLMLLSGGETIPRHLAQTHGVDGVVCTDQPAREISLAVHRAARGQSVFPLDAGFDGLELSERERQVLDLLALGRTNREIAGELFLSPDTVKFHTRRLYRKLDARNRTDAVQRARRMGLLTGP
jgi:DNA-binding NarL/FixJ family response regulator